MSEMKNVMSLSKMLLLVMVLASCNNPMSKNYSRATYIQDMDAIRESSKISFDDIDLLTRYVALSRIAGNELEGKTYREILVKIKDIRKANTDQADLQTMEKDAARERMNPYITVALSGKNYSKVNNKDCLIYTVIFQNQTAKNIKMVVGSISINDLLDREIIDIPIVLDEPLKANATEKKIYTVDYNNNNESDRSIRLKELVDLRILWNPLKIIFDNGTVVE